jgi:hypothetical protein
MSQPSNCAARRYAASTPPPISTTGRPRGGSGPIAPANPKDSPAHTRCIWSSIASNRRPRLRNGTPEAS